MRPLTLREWRGVGLACCAFVLVILTLSTRTLRQTERQLAQVTRSLDSVTKQLDSARGLATQLAAERQAARDSAAIERVIRDSLYRVATQRRAALRHWEATVASLQLASVVDTMPLLEQVQLLRDETGRLQIAGDATAVALTAQTELVAALQDSDQRERTRADSADARASRAEAALAAQLAQARAGVQASLRAARRPWYRRALSGAAHVGEKALVAVPAFFIGRWT